MATEQNKIDEAFREMEGSWKDLLETDFESFCKIAGINKTRAVVCMARARGLSWQQIEIKYDVPASTARDLVKKCTDNPQPSDAGQYDAE